MKYVSEKTVEKNKTQIKLPIHPPPRTSCGFRDKKAKEENALYLSCFCTYFLIPVGCNQAWLAWHMGGATGRIMVK